MCFPYQTGGEDNETHDSQHAKGRYKPRSEHRKNKLE